jgi:hypothetical protein
MQRLISTRLAIFGHASFDQLSTSLPSLCTRQLHASITILQSSATGGKDGQPSDPFTQQLQDKTERELADLVAAAAARKKTAAPDSDSDDEKPELPPARDDEIGGPKGKEPTRYGDWEKGGRCTDF